MNLKKTLILAFFLIFIYNCSKIDPVTGEKVIIDPNPVKRAEAARDQSGGIFGAITQNKSQNTFEFSTSNVLWRATLKYLDFLPLLLFI